MVIICVHHEPICHSVYHNPAEIANYLVSSFTGFIGSECMQVFLNDTSLSQITIEISPCESFNCLIMMDSHTEFLTLMVMVLRKCIKRFKKYACSAGGHPEFWDPPPPYRIHGGYFVRINV